MIHAWLIPKDMVDIDSDARAIDEEGWDEDDGKEKSRWDKFWDTIL